MARVAVVGVGYVGLTTAVGLGALGHDVVGIDTSVQRVDSLNSGQCPIYEAGLPELLTQVVGNSVTFTTDHQKAVAEADVVFLSVPTPQDEDGSADMSYVLTAAIQVAPHMKSRSVLVTKSTVPVGSSALVANAIGRSDVAIASNPEFLREGTAVHDFMNPERIVIGTDESWAADVLAELYKDLNSPIVRTSPASAEMIKYASNSFLSVKLSFVNDLADLCERTGADIVDVTAGMGLDSRIGAAFLKPGPGWGGSCFPKDARALNALAAQVDATLPLVEASITSNERAHRRVVDMVADAVGGTLTGHKVACWGIAYKAGTDDTRESPAIAVMNLLTAQGADVWAYDPIARVPDGSAITQKPSALEALENADVLVVLTEWSDFAAVDAREALAHLKSPAVIDTRNVLSHDKWRSAGAFVRVLGRPQ